MSSISLEGRTAIVTGAGAGLGRSKALALAAGGASVVVNDVHDEAAQAVVAEIEAVGGRALAVVGDVADWQIGDHLVEEALNRFGSVDIVVNNAGVLRDHAVFDLVEADWDATIRVHLKGAAAVTRAVAAHWKTASEQAGGPVYGRLINIASESYLYGPQIEPGYATAKGGLISLTLSTAQTLAPYGVRVNAFCPRAKTAMTEWFFGPLQPTGADGVPDWLAPERAATVVAYLASPAAEAISGQVIVAYGDFVAVLAPPSVEAKFTAERGAFTPESLSALLTPYFADRAPDTTYIASSVAALDITNAELPTP